MSDKYTQKIYFDAEVDVNKKSLQKTQKEIENLNPKIEANISIKNASNEFGQLKRQIDELAKSQAAQLKTLKEAGQAGTKEYKNLEAQLQNTYKYINDLDKTKLSLNVDTEAFNKLQNTLHNLDLGVDTQKLENQLKSITQSLKDVGSIDLESLKQFAAYLPEEQFKQLNEDLVQLGINLGKVKFGNDAKLAAEEYDRALITLQKLIDAQKKELDNMKKNGLEGTAAYNQLNKTLEETVNELYKLQNTNNNVNFEKPAKNFNEAISQFGFVSQGISTFVTSLQTITDPFVNLDTATARIKTLGGAAKENAENFKEMSLQMSKKIPINAADIQLASYNALSAGIKATTEDMNAFMEASAKLAVGGAESINNTVDLLSSLINAYGESAEKATEYSDALFKTVNLGKTTIPELTQALSQVIPTAAAYGASIRDVGAALALMTAKGVPTAQATTRLNQMLIQMQKPSANLRKIIAATSLSVEELGNKVKGGDFIGALKDLQKAFEETGYSATQAFGSAEASSAFNTLTGDIDALANTLNEFNNAAGTTEDAFNDMSNTIENRAAQLKSSLDSILASVIDITGPVGEYGVASIKVMQEMLPYIQTLNGVGTLFGNLQGMIGGVGTAISTKLIPSLLKYDTTVGSVTKAHKALNIAMNVIKANPLLAIVTGLVAVGSAVAKIVSELNKSAEEQKKINLETKKHTEELINNNKQRIDTINNIDVLIKKYEILGKKTSLTKKEEAELADVQKQLNKEIPEAQIGVLSYSESLDILRKKSAESSDELARLKTETKQFEKNKIQLDVELATNDVDIELEKLQKNITEATEGGYFSQAGYNLANDILKGFSFGLLDATPSSKKLANNISKSIKEATNDAELAKAKEQMQELFNSDWWQKEATAAEKDSLIKSFDALTEAKVKEIQAVEKAKMETLSIAIKEAYEQNVKETAGGMITDEAARKIAEQTETTVDEVKNMYNQIKNEAVKANIGEQIENIVKSTEKLGDIKALKQLEDDFKNAKNAAEKAQIAEKIQEWAPAAVKVVDTIIDENGKLVNSYEISGEAIDSITDSLSKQANKELIDNQKALLNTFEKQGETFAYNEKKLKDLQKQIKVKTLKGEDVSSLRNEYDKLANSMSEQKNVMIEQLKQMEKEGTATDKIYNSIAKSIKQQPEELKKVIQAEVQRTAQMEKQKQLQEEINKAATYNMNAANQAIQEAKNNLQSSYLAMRQWEQLNPNLNKQTDKHAQDLQRAIDANVKLLQDAYSAGGYVRKAQSDFDAMVARIEGTNKKTSESSKNTQTELEKREKILNTLKNQYDAELQLYKINQDKNILVQNRERNNLDELEFQQKQLEFLDKQKKDLIENLKLQENFIDLQNMEDLAIGIKLKEDEKEKAKKYVLDFIKDYNDLVGSIETIKLKYDLTEYEILEARLKEKENLIKLNVGIDEDALLNTTNELNEITDKMLNILSNKSIEIKNKLTEAVKDGTNKEYIRDLQKELNETQSVINDLISNRVNATKEAADKEIEIIKNKYEKETELNKNSYDKQKEQAANFVNFLNNSLIATIQAKLEIDTKGIDADLQAELDALDAQYNKKQKLTLKEEQYNKKKLEIEKRYQEEKEKLQIQSNYRQQSLQLQNQRRLAELEEEQKNEQLRKEEEYYKKSLELQISLLETLKKQREATNDAGIQAMYDAEIKKTETAAEQMKLKIVDIENTMSTVNQNLALSGEEIAKTFTNIFDSMVASGEQITTIKDGLRLILKTFSEFLIREAEAALETYLFSSEFWLNLVAKSGGIIAFVPALLAIAKSSLKAIISPLITSITSKLLSFSTGGRIDSPTLALVGDGTKLGGTNKEWIFRDDQLRSLVEDVVIEQNNKISNSFKSLQNTISNINLTTTIKGSDLLLSMKRTEFENSIRNY